MTDLERVRQAVDSAAARRDSLQAKARETAEALAALVAEKQTIARHAAEEGDGTAAKKLRSLLVDIGEHEARLDALRGMIQDAAVAFESAIAEAQPHEAQEVRRLKDAERERHLSILREARETVLTDYLKAARAYGNFRLCVNQFSALDPGGAAGVANELRATLARLPQHENLATVPEAWGTGSNQVLLVPLMKR